MKMKKNLFLTIAAGMLSLSTASAQVHKPSPGDTSPRQKEHLDRGLIQIKETAAAAFLSWRYLDTDDEHTSFRVLKIKNSDGSITPSDPIRNATSIRMSGSLTSYSYKLVTYQNGVPVDTIAPKLFSNLGYHLLQMDRPAGGSTSSGSYTYSPNDCSVGDVDGDGEYELFVKWDPNNSKDNSQDGVTGNVFIDCYKPLTGEKLWRIDLGKNIRAGAHYTQFLVYDFDGDGKAEMICKTGPGSLDGTGVYVNQAADDEALKSASNTADHRTSSGRIDGGYEYLTVFNGETGKAIHTIHYLPNRNNELVKYNGQQTLNWYNASGKNDNHGYNRGERYLATVAFLGGKDSNPSAVMCRGYYSFSNLWAVDFDGAKLKTRWIHQSKSTSLVELTDANGNKTSKTYSKNTDPKRTHSIYTAYAQGCHSISAGDVDGDGCDEIMYGSAAINNDGSLLYSTGLGHGDAQHLGDMDPDRDGLEYFQVHEESPYGCHYRDAGTGELIYCVTGDADNGRGVAADVYPTARGYEFWSAKVNDTRNVQNKVVSSKKPSMNFRIYWDGDEYDELLDGTKITKWYSDGTTTELGICTSLTASTQSTWSSLGMSPSSCNSTKSTPCLTADIFGDWREEVLWWNSNDPSQMYIVSSTIPVSHRLPTLMHDNVYRLGITWQNSAYNQPPHLGYYLPDYISTFDGIEDTDDGIVSVDNDTQSILSRQYFSLDGKRVSRMNMSDGVYVERIVKENGEVSVKKYSVK